MSKRVLVEIYFSYGKGDGAELYDRFVINNTIKERDNILDNFSYDEALDNEEDFIKGKNNYFNFQRYGGDWDEPTGGYVSVYTKDELVNKVKIEAREEIENIERLFEKE